MDPEETNAAVVFLGLSEPDSQGSAAEASDSEPCEERQRLGALEPSRYGPPGLGSTPVTHQNLRAPSRRPSRGLSSVPKAKTVLELGEADELQDTYNSPGPGEAEARKRALKPAASLYAAEDEEAAVGAGGAVASMPPMARRNWVRQDGRFPRLTPPQLHPAESVSESESDSELARSLVRLNPTRRHSFSDSGLESPRGPFGVRGDHEAGESSVNRGSRSFQKRPMLSSLLTLGVFLSLLGCVGALLLHNFNTLHGEVATMHEVVADLREQIATLRADSHPETSHTLLATTNTELREVQNTVTLLQSQLSDMKSLQASVNELKTQCATDKASLTAKVETLQTSVTDLNNALIEAQKSHIRENTLRSSEIDRLQLDLATAEAKQTAFQEATLAQIVSTTESIDMQSVTIWTHVNSTRALSTELDTFREDLANQQEITHEQRLALEAVDGALSSIRSELLAIQQTISREATTRAAADTQLSDDVAQLSVTFESHEAPVHTKDASVSTEPPLVGMRAVGSVLQDSGTDHAPLAKSVDTVSNELTDVTRQLTELQDRVKAVEDQPKFGGMFLLAGAKKECASVDAKFEHLKGSLAEEEEADATNPLTGDCSCGPGFKKVMLKLANAEDGSTGQRYLFYCMQAPSPGSSGKMAS